MTTELVGQSVEQAIENSQLASDSVDLEAILSGLIFVTEQQRPLGFERVPFDVVGQSTQQNAGADVAVNIRGCSSV